MSILIIDRESARRLLTYDLCIPLMEQAMSALSAKRTQQLLRQILDLGEDRLFGVMPGATEDVFGAKLVSVFASRGAATAPSHQGLLTLFDPSNGAPLAVIHAGEVTAIRTAAATAAATRALARPEARSLAILGCGEQAFTHAHALSHTHSLEEIRIWGRSQAAADFLALRLAETLAAPITAFSTVEETVAGADIICTVSAASEPILLSRWVADGTHINLVGSSRAGPREVDDALVVRSRFFADHREGVLRQGAEVLHAKAAGLIDDDHVLGEIGEVMAGDKVGRRSRADVTAYKSLGSIVQDLASGWLIYQRARETGAGVRVSF